ncbi:hypothetical protein GMMP15_560063 [Candidatus Magnetomoraceae bacterium gMMP-15]
MGHGKKVEMNRFYQNFLYHLNIIIHAVENLNTDFTVFAKLKCKS